MMNNLKILFFLLVAAILVPNEVMAEEETQSEHSNELEHRHSVAFFMGNTHESGEDGFTVGIPTVRNKWHRWVNRICFRRVRLMGGCSALIYLPIQRT